MFTKIMNNKLLVSVIAGWTSAQMIKIILYYFTHKKFSAERFVGAGGMPSSHSAAVTAFAASAGRRFGLESYEFAFAAVFACIVMYDACGVRRAVGEHARHLNEINFSMTDDRPADVKFKELIGHTPIQVLVGFLIGLSVAYMLY